MEEQLDALIYQNEKNSDEANKLLEALIVQNDKNNPQSELEAIAKSNLDTKNVIKKKSKELIKAVKELKTEPITELTVKNTDDISKNIVESINTLAKVIKSHHEANMAEKKAYSKDKATIMKSKEKESQDFREKVLLALKVIDDSIPSENYHNDFQLVKNAIDDKDFSLKSVEDLLRLVGNKIDKIGFPQNLTEDDRVKVQLSDEQIKKILKGLNIQVTNSSSEYAVNVAGQKINRATEEKQNDIIDALEDIEAKQGEVNAYGTKLISTYANKFRDDFATFDEVNNWEVIQVGSGQSYTLRGAANGARFLAINSGTLSGAETIILSRPFFKIPFKVAFGVSVTLSSDTSGAATTGRQANLWPIIEVVECDENGDVVETADAQTYSGLVPNCMAYVYNGTTVTTQTLIMRTSGNSESAVATAMGTYSSTTPSGSYPNYIQAGNQIMFCNNEFAYYTNERPDLTTAGTLSKKNTSLLDPDKCYKIRIRLKNAGTVVPADFNIHMVRMMDMTRTSVDFGAMNGCQTDAQQALPFYSVGGTYIISEAPSTSYGIALYHTATSANSINATLVKTGASLLNSLDANNIADYTCYLKLYNKATTAPDPATDTPILSLPISPGENLSPLIGRFADRFTLGLGYVITKNEDPTDTTPVEAGDVKLNISYA